MGERHHGTKSECAFVRVNRSLRMSEGASSSNQKTSRPSSFGMIVA
jgi:hypothetical protein